ncbi:MAG: 3-hydroxyacyl-[acyl-carrier-protein] dehydratase FabZ [Gammaproteobacteria bacterium RIFCSPHIGHO2_12_FULL_45_9]|nr:MAG: 3-hydroxyacyl-[acyl-carrier-protein] dehydratase FabZ [Gammaproteobacteria bacterium RIFCSPHIGHO2_12_FULL_45_9]
MSGEMYIDEIKQCVPHRYPFLLVDRILSYELNRSIVGIKNVTVNEPFFNGHFPVKPVMPGVLMTEAMAQTAGILITKILELPPFHQEIFFLAGLDNVRYKRIVVPGDQLRFEMEVLKVRRELWKFQGMATVAGELACSAEILIVRGS